MRPATTICWALALLVPAVQPNATAIAQTTWYVDDDAPNDPGPGDPMVSDPAEDGSAKGQIVLLDRTTEAIRTPTLGGLGPQAVGLTAFQSVPVRPTASGTWRQRQRTGGRSTYISLNIEPEGDVPQALAFTPDGGTVIIANRDTDNVTFLDVATQLITHTVPVGQCPVDVAVTPDGHYAIVPNQYSNTVSFVDIPLHAPAAEVAITGQQPFQVAVTADGQHVVVGVANDGAGSSFSIIDTDTLSEVLSFDSAPQGVSGYTIIGATDLILNHFSEFLLTPDGATILLPDYFGTYVYAYDVTSGTETMALELPGEPRTAAISTDGTFAFVFHTGTPYGITMINLTTHEIDNEFPVSATSWVPANLQITSDEAYAILSLSDEVLFVDLESGDTTARQEFGSSIWDLQLSFDGQYAIASSYYCHVFDAGSQTLVSSLAPDFNYESAVSPTELRAAVLDNRFREDVHLFNIDGETSFFEGRVSSGELPEADAPQVPEVSHDGLFAVVTNYASRNVSIIDLLSRSALPPVDIDGTPIDVALTPDDHYAVVAGAKPHTASVVDLVEREQVATLPLGTSPIRIRMGPSGQQGYVLTWGAPGEIYFIDLDGPNSSIHSSMLAGYTAFAGGYADMRLTPDSAILGVCIPGDDELLLIDTATRSELVRVPVGRDPLALAFSPDGARAYVANYSDNTLSVISIDGASSAVETTITEINALPQQIVVDAEGSYVYVTTAAIASRFYVIDSATHSVLTWFTLSSHVEEGAHLSSWNRTLYLAGNNWDGLHELIRVRAAGADSYVIGSTSLSEEPAQMAFSEAMHMAVVTEPSPDGVDVIQYCPADLNGDGFRNMTDFTLWAAAYPSNLGEPQFDPLADLNGDGTINVGDLMILMEAYGVPCP